ncbi:MAG: hypothetical protein ABEJ26_00015 [Halosimplex sp.]
MSEQDDAPATDSRTGRYSIGRRALLRAAGVGVGGAALSGTFGSVAADSDHYQGPVARTYEAATIDPSDINQFGGGGNAADDEGEGEAIDKVVPRKAPDAKGDRGGGGKVQREAPEETLVETDFEGMNALDVRGVVPSDAQIAAGPADLVQAINSQVGFFGRDGDQSFQASLDAFFAPVSPLIDEGSPGSGFFESYIIFDPRARYDPDSGRFLLACVDYSLETGLGAILLAVSSSSNPMDPWSLYRVPPVAQQGETPVPGLVDYPQLGYDDEAVYLTQNFFPGAFSQATMVALDKSAATAGEAADANHFTGLRNPDGSLAFTVQPADGGGYFVNSTYFQGQTLTLWSTTDPLSSDPTLTNEAVGVEPYTNPPEGANQPDTEEKIDMGDDRILRVSYDGDSVWASHTIDDGRARWYELAPNGDDPAAVRRSGAFRERGEKTFYPAIAADGDDAVFVYNRSSPKDNGDGFVDIGVAAVGDGEVSAFETVKGGDSDYDYVDGGEGDDGTQTLRWGDYNGIETDPAGDGFWVVSQYGMGVDLGGDEQLEDDFYGARIAKVSVDG